MIANLGMIFAGLLVNLFNSRFPDLIIGIEIALLVFLGGIEIVRDARRERVNLRSCISRRSQLSKNSVNQFNNSIFQHKS